MRLALLALFAACTPKPDAPPAETAPDDALHADVVEVTWAGAEGAWVFTVSLLSPDVDCTRYADWWELVDPSGALVYRRILNHSHADEQPFARSGDPLAVASDQELVVRGHLHPQGYGGAAFRGSLATGFALDPTVTAAFAPDLEGQAPLPEECWW